MSGFAIPGQPVVLVLLPGLARLLAAVEVASVDRKVLFVKYR